MVHTQLHFTIKSFAKYACMWLLINPHNVAVCTFAITHHLFTQLCYVHACIKCTEFTYTEHRCHKKCFISYYIFIMGRKMNYINQPKCERFSQIDTSIFPASMKSCYPPNIDILGAPISENLHCTNFIPSKRDKTTGGSCPN